VRDSLRIYYVLLRYLVSSLISAVVDNLLFVVAFAATSSLLSAQVVGRIGGASVNFWLNRSRVFLSRQPRARTLARYLTLVMASGAISYGLIRALVAGGLGILASKILAESLVFFGNFALQRRFVFPPEAPGAPAAHR
jgi:putative flippase GtrA